MTGVSERPIRPEELLDLVSADGNGAQALFLGVVRDNHEGLQVNAVTYDAFVPLAEKVLDEISREAAQKWGVYVAAAHRIGRLSVGDASVGIAVASAHRAEAFDACRYVIEQIKTRLPVWKKEHYADGASSWLAGCALAAKP